MTVPYFGDDQGLRLWNIKDGKREAMLTGGFASGKLLGFSPDEQFVATGSKFEIRIWDLASRQIVQVIDAFGSAKVGLNWLPETQLLLIATEDGRVRIWGTPAAGERLSLRPMHAAVKLPDSSSREPLTPAQLVAAVDLRAFPLLPGSETRVYGKTNLHCEAPVTEDEARLFYRYFLTQSGWSEVAPSATTPGSLQFRKGGCRLSASFPKAGDSKTTIHLGYAGNYDLRWAPKFDAAPVEVVTENEDAVVYCTKANLIDIESTLLRRMHEAGWTAYSRLHSSYNETPDARDLEFLRDSTILRVSVGKFPTDPSSYTVQYSRFLTTNSLPIPPDSGFVEFDGSTQPYLVATTKMNLTQAREFYEKQLVAQGWLPRAIGRSIKKDVCRLPFIQGEQDLSLGLVSQPNGRTLVRVGDRLEDSSWQLARPKPAAKTVIAPIGIQAADFPLLNPSKSADFNPDAKSIELKMGAVRLSEVADQYTKELESKGWTTKGTGIRSDDYVFLTFSREKAEIELRARLTGGEATLNVQGDGILWTKPLPGGQQVISYETWLRRNQRPASLELLDEYVAAMRAIATARPAGGK